MMPEKAVKLDVLIATLKEHTQSMTPPLVDTIIAEFGHDPFLILISCLLSLRAKDSTTVHVCRELFARVRTPQQLVAMDRTELEKIIFKTGFYKTKAHVLQHVSQVLLERFKGQVPRSYDDLASITGIGPKTANLVLGLGFGVPAICVDTHVHRISNRLGIIKTKTVEESEAQLKRVLPENYWTLWNHLLVIWGQNVCVPVSPKCSGCAIREMCPRVGVGKSR